MINLSFSETLRLGNWDPGEWDSSEFLRMNSDEFVKILKHSVSRKKKEGK